MSHVEESINAFRVLVGKSEKTDELVDEEIGG
jgi:hypothetical protein